MPTWNPDQYLKFADERSRPCRDLAAHVEVWRPLRIIDLGCGPGNSAEVIVQRWPDAAITGLDSSPHMIEKARALRPESEWRAGDIAEWAATKGERFDIVFSNAALQWVDGHGRLLPQIFDHVESGGALAVQLPGNYDGSANRLMRELSASETWRRSFPNGVKGWHAHDLDFYYNALEPHAARLDLWAIEYWHRMPNTGAIVEFYKGTGLRPYLELLPNDGERARFLSEYEAKLALAFPAQPNGVVLFSFRRIFIVAYRE
ncbi:MAG TPA: methyltransferase domain-containing protein [Bryobacteraceae bacterium]|jgi:trans-aconitate 2-methyltransferase|nr:methyltransferase domain-containing protein [Bryobacteraceae bacterium]